MKTFWLFFETLGLGSAVILAGCAVALFYITEKTGQLVPIEEWVLPIWFGWGLIAYIRFFNKIIKTKGV